MKIGITCHATMGGSGAIATALGGLLSCEGHEVHFICHDEPFDLAGARQCGVAFHKVEATQYPPLKYPPFDMAMAVKMADVAKRAKLDLLHVHYAIPYALGAHIAREMVAPQSLKLVCTLHGTDTTLVGSDLLYRPLVRFLLQASDAVTAVSRWLAEAAESTFGFNKEVKTIYNFIDTEEYKRSGKRSGGRPTLVHVSNFRPIKRATDVIEIFKRVRDKAEARLIMVGDGPDRSRTMALARSLGVESDVDFIGTTHNVVDILSSADLFLLPSEMESFGLAALEAMACEIPVVAADVGGLAEVVEDGSSGYLLPLGDVDAMAECALEMLDDDRLRERMGKRGRSIAVEKFSPRRALEAYLSLYESLLV